jgi:phage protein D
MIPIKNNNVRGYSQPRSIVRLDGNKTFFLNWSVNLNSNRYASDFTISLPFKITNNVKKDYLISTNDGTSLLFTKSNILVEIFVGFPQNAQSYTTNDLTRIMYGYVDTIELNLSEHGEVINLTGRSQVAPLLDNKTTNKFQNMTSSAVARMFAKNHGLNTQIQDTYTLAGHYYSGDSINMTKDNCEWDILAYLADNEGFEVMVWDNTLYFMPASAIQSKLTTNPLDYAWGWNILECQISRSPHAAKNIIVNVHSFNKSTHKHIKAKAQRNTTYQTSVNQTYYYTGLTQDQAQKRANSLLDQLSKMELIAQMQVSGNSKLIPNQPINLQGVGKGLSQTYYIRKATHTFDMEQSGYFCDIYLSNLLLQDDGGM